MVWRIEISGRAQKHLKSIDKASSERILLYLKERVRIEPRRFGEQLKGSKLGDLWRYRVGNYRILAEIKDDVLRVVIVRIGHRKDIYRK